MRDVLSALAPQIERCKEPFNAQVIGNSLYGLQGCIIDHADTIFVVLTPQTQRLLDELRRTQHPERGLPALPAADLLPVAHGCAAILSGAAATSHPSPGLRFSVLESLYSACARELESRPVEALQTSESEKRFRARAVALFSGGPLSVSVRPDACYLHGFEADIVLILRPPTGSRHAPATVNIEVDGPWHRSQTSRLFCTVRDAHLRSRGVEVLRWDLMAKNGGSKGAFDTWLREEIIRLQGYLFASREGQVSGR